MKTTQTNRATPHPTEPTLLCRWTRLESGHRVLVGTCPTCKRIKVHEWAKGIPRDRYSRRTCMTCPTGTPSAYWLKIAVNKLITNGKEIHL